LLDCFSSVGVCALSCIPESRGVFSIMALPPLLS
jgi:hypothetical protein